MIDMYKFNRRDYQMYSKSLCISHSGDVPIRRRKESPLSSLGEELLIRVPFVIGLIGFGCLDLVKLRESCSRGSV